MIPPPTTTTFALLGSCFFEDENCLELEQVPEMNDASGAAEGSTTDQLRCRVNT